MYRLYVALRLGKMLASRGRPDEAEGVYVSVLSDPVVLAGQFTVHARSRVPNSLEKEFSRVLRDYAALLEARGKAGDATRVRAEHLARLRAAVPPSGSDSPSALTRRARLLARVGQFKEAADDYARAIELDPGDHWRWYPLGCLLAYADQPDAYRDHCRAMLRRFGASTDRFIAGRTAKTCLLLPGVTPDLTPQLRLVDVVLAPGANQQHMPWFRQLKGIAEYRRGHFAAAIESFEQSRRLLPADFETSEAVALLFLAMSHHQLGHAERARGLLAEARGMMEQKVPKAGVDDLEASLIEFWLVCHVIRREAEALFAGG
jgi:tetratricopeptide (TPR) repeat protein